MENGKTHEWTDEEVKRLQLVLMNNQVEQGTQTDIVKSNLETAFQLGTLANVALTSGNIEAAEEFSKLLIAATCAETAQVKES